MAAYKIYVDPGHGGTDAGAVSNGVKESTINIAVANLLVSELKRNGFGVKTCRTDDKTTKSLADRVNEANTYKSDAYVSLHANWSSSAEPNGTQTYVCAFGGNAEKLAKCIQGNLQPINGVSKWERVEDDNFYVLRKTTMPAVLIELGFISNSVDRVYLTNPTNQKYLAQQICKGICKHFGVTYKAEAVASKVNKVDNTPDSYAAEDIKWAVDKGLLKGNENGDYMLHSNITRQDMFVILHRYDQLKK